MTRAVSVAGPGGVGGSASVVAGQAGVESSGPRVRRQWRRGVGRQGRRGVGAERRGRASASVVASGRAIV